METIGDSVPPCVYTIDDSVPPATLVEPSPVGGQVIDDDGLLDLLNDPMDEPPVGVANLDDGHSSSVATTELDVSSDESVDGADAHYQTTTLDDIGPGFVRMHRDWWLGISGVVDLRRFGPGRDATSAKVQTYCAYTIGRLVGASIGYGNAVYKVGTAHDLFDKFNSYVLHDPKPFRHMFLLHRTGTREGAGFLAASLIKRNWCIPRFVNKERRDMGGEDGETSGCFVYVIAGCSCPPSVSRLYAPRESGLSTRERSR